MALLGADQQLSFSRLNRVHCFDCVQNQVQDDLLQLDAIAPNGKQSFREPGLDRNSILDDFTLRQYNDLVDRPIEIKAILSRRRFLDVVTHPIDDLRSSIGIADDTAERFLDLAQIRQLLVQKFRAALALLRAVAIGCLIS